MSVCSLSGRVFIVHHNTWPHEIVYCNEIIIWINYALLIQFIAGYFSVTRFGCPNGVVAFKTNNYIRRITAYGIIRWPLGLWFMKAPRTITKDDAYAKCQCVPCCTCMYVYYACMLMFAVSGVRYACIYLYDEYNSWMHAQTNAIGSTKHMNVVQIDIKFWY